MALESVCYEDVALSNLRLNENCVLLLLRVAYACGNSAHVNGPMTVRIFLPEYLWQEKLHSLRQRLGIIVNPGAHIYETFLVPKIGACGQDSSKSCQNYQKRSGQGTPQGRAPVQQTLRAQAEHCHRKRPCQSPIDIRVIELRQK